MEPAQPNTPPDGRSVGPESDQGPEEVAAEAGLISRLAGLWRYGRVVLQIGLPLLVIWLVWHEIRSLDINSVHQSLGASDARLIALGVLAAFGAVIVMGLYDAFAFPRGAKGTLTFGRRWLLGSVLFGWTNFISMGPIGGPAIRILAYRRFGLTGPEITRGFVGHTIGGSSGLAAWLLAVWLPDIPGLGGAWALAARALIALVATITLASVAGRVVMATLGRHRYGSELRGIPLARLGAVSFLEWGLTLLSFALLVRGAGVSVGIVGEARTVFTGQLAGLASMIPGGIGSADAVWFKGFGLLGVAHEPAATAIVLFRAGYYLVPWVVAVAVIYTVLAIHSQALRLWQRRLVAGAVLLNAILLLLSAATPSVRERLDAVEDVVPLGAIEVSHLLAAVSAVLMVLMVRGLLRGYRGAYYFVAALLAASAVAHPIKGGDIEEAIASLVLLGLLVGVRGAFTRRGRVPVGWELVLAGGVGSLAFFLVIGMAGFERVPYRTELWTTFAEKAEASRFIRASGLLAIVTLALAVRQATRPVRLWVTPTDDEIDRAEAFIRAHADTADPLMVAGGDKGVWFYEPKPGKPPGGLVLYQRWGDRIIVFKDPVLAGDTNPAGLIEAFLAFSDTLDVDVVFSSVSGRWMNHLHDFGFHFLKMNEEAIVPLAGYSLQGGRNANFRRLLRETEKLGVTYELLEPPFDPAIVDRLRHISDTWLESKGVSELQFSACCFSPGYIQRHPIGVARDDSGAIVAFVNLLITRPGGPATLDFMRYLPGRYDNIMDYVLLKTMLLLGERGITSFSLGAAPLNDVGVRRGSRLSERFLHFFSTKAERIYNYQGLVHYKNKFHPQWEPRYLAYQHPWDWAASLVASTRLVQGRRREDRRRIAAARIGTPANAPGPVAPGDAVAGPGP